MQQQNTAHHHQANAQLALVGRQSIYNPNLEVFGYELLFRATAGQNFAPSTLNGDQATTEVMLNAFFELGIENVVADKHAFINLTNSFINGAINIPLPKKNLVLEVLETVEPNEAVLKGLKDLKDRGYIIALDDFDFNESAMPLLPLADIVKVDLSKLDQATLTENIGLFTTQYQPRLLAEKVETMEDFELCKSLGFQLFQGFFLQKPVVIQGRKMPANKLAILQLLQRLQDPEVQTEELEALIKQDVTLSYKVLRYINSPAFGLSSEISSIKQAVVLLGLNSLKRWVSLIVIAGICDKSHDLIRISLVRAKMCELIAQAKKQEKTEDYFMMGLFSLLDAMLDQNIEEVLKSIPLNAELKNALIHSKGKMGYVLKNIKSYELGEWDDLLIDPSEAQVYRDSYLDAIAWAENTLAGL